MFIRLVKMEFRTEAIPVFKEIFDQSSPFIRAFPGCEFLELWQDQHHQAIFFTHSHWTGPEALEAYRHSDLFQQTWAQTKPLFARPAQAWSVDRRMIFY